MSRAAGIFAAGWGERLGKKIPKALTPVGSRKLIDFALDGLEAAGITTITCIVNEEATSVPEYVSQTRPHLKMDWIIQTTPSSMHSFLIVLERLAELHGDQQPFMLTTVDSVCPPTVHKQFAADARSFSDADVVLGLTSYIDDEKPLRVAMRGKENTGLMPTSIAEDPSAYEILAMTNNGFDSGFITAGFYQVHPRVLREKEAFLAKNFTALRQLLGHLLKYGYRFYGVPLPKILDVDRPEDVQSAIRFLEGTGHEASGTRDK